jgi:hypothetical protein
VEAREWDHYDNQVRGAEIPGKRFGKYSHAAKRVVNEPGTKRDNFPTELDTSGEYLRCAV